MIQPAKHTVVMISIVEYDPQSQDTSTGRGHNQDTKFTVRADGTNAAIDKAIRRLTGFKDED